MREAILTLALVRLRLDTPLLGLNAAGAGAGAVQQHGHRLLVHLPEEIWVLVWGCLRSADFEP